MHTYISFLNEIEQEILSNGLSLLDGKLSGMISMRKFIYTYILYVFIEVVNLYNVYPSDDR